MKPKLLITRQIFDEVLERLTPHFDIASNQSDAPWSRAELIERVADRDALFVVTSDRVDSDLLAAAPKLRMVATGSVGFNHIDLAACA
ncbi:MAG: D-glycerate dehydrogenase, partial [Betaproteobacteria bacterium]